jgi:hypothetical protein
LDQKAQQIREAAEGSLYSFIKLVAPHRVLGSIHEEVIDWWTREDAKDHQLLLLPRDHQKSAMIAYRVAWEITRNPAVTVLYISSTSTLAEKQLKFIKDILESKIYRKYWPEMIHPDEGKRAKWNEKEMSVDHPIRVKEGVRDSTVFTAGLTTNITGLHCEIAVLDDVVVNENAYNREGRDKVKRQYSLLSSIETTGAREWAVGTRYHGDDLYHDMQEAAYEIYDDDGNLVDEQNIYEIFQRQVEDRGDGTGEYLWPRQQRYDGRWFGFDQNILAVKRGKYLDKAQFRSQYYNDPNDPDNEAISKDYIQYYDRKFLVREGTHWHFKGKRLNVYAAIDFAFSLRNTADYTALVTIGVDELGNYYLLDIDRFRTNKISDYFKAIMDGAEHWGYRKLRAEVTVAQEAIVEELKERIKEAGLAISVDKYRPDRSSGTKEERIEAILKPRYENMAVWHYRGGLCQQLEDELRQQRPAHDDIKDALAQAIDLAVIPRAASKRDKKIAPITTHPRFGGVAIGG